MQTMCVFFGVSAHDGASMTEPRSALSRVGMLMLRKFFPVRAYEGIRTSYAVPTSEVTTADADTSRGCAPADTSLGVDSWSPAEARTTDAAGNRGDALRLGDSCYRRGATEE